METIASIRKKYPWIAYGNEYDRMKSELKYFNWLINALDNERPADQECHEVRTCAFDMWRETGKYRDLLKKLPKPTKEQRNDDYDPWTKGLWPEDKISDIETAWRKMQIVRDIASRAANSLVRSKYAKEVLHDKVCKSLKEKEK